MEGGEGEREEGPKRAIITTELVAGADFFHHLPCAAGRQRLEDWRESELNPAHNQTQASEHHYSKSREKIRL